MVDQRLVQGNIFYVADIAWEREQYPDISWEVVFQLTFDSPFDPTFLLQVTAIETLIVYNIIIS